MALVKLGEAVQIRMDDVHPADSVLADPEILSRMADDSLILANFKKYADELKKLAPKAKDFLYFSAIMMHAAEAALLESDGSLKKNAKGDNLEASWDKRGDSWRWICNDSDTKPYKNSNNDIFPEEELIKAHKKWVGRPLCLDHKSSSVDMIRGVIVDTYYDRKHKRVIALCALDKINYPDLARKVSTGYASSVSMGTAVGKAICTDCGQVARIEADFCDHMRRKSCYGEINIDLNPIELSIVVNGADPQAKIRHIVAAADKIAEYVEMKKDEFKKIAEDETRDIELATKVEAGLEKAMQELSALKEQIAELKSREQAEQNKQMSGVDAGSAMDGGTLPKAALDKIERMQKDLNKLQEQFNKLGEEKQMTTKSAYFQGGGGVNEPTPGKPKYEKEDEDSIRNNQDKQMGGQMDTGPVDGMHPGYDSFGETEEARKKRLLRASAEDRELRRQAAVKAAQEVVKSSYYQGGGGANEPTPGKPKYPKEDSDKIREKEDKQMNGAPPFPGVGKIDGLYDKDLEEKKRLLRAKLNAKFIKAANPGESRWDVYADGKLIYSSTVNEITGNKADALYGVVATKEFGREMLSKFRTENFDKVASLYKGAQGAPLAPAAPLPTGAGLPGGDATSDPLSGGPAVGSGPVDAGKSGDPKEQISDISHQLSNLAADLAQASEALSEAPANELSSFDELAGGDTAGGAGGADATATASLIEMQKKLSNALVLGINAKQKEIRDHLDELKISSVLVSDQSTLRTVSAEEKASINQIVTDGIADAKYTIADGVKLMNAFVKYARGTQSLVKRAKAEIAMKKSAQALPGIGESSPQVQNSLESVNPQVKKTPEGHTARWDAGVGKYLVDEYPGKYWDPKTGHYGDLKGGKPAPAPAGAAMKQAPTGPTTPAAPSAPAGGTVNMGVMDPADRGKALQMGGLKGRQPGAATGVTTPDAAGHGTKTPGKPGDYSASAHAGEPGAKADDSGSKDDMGDLKVGPDGSMDGSPEEVGKAMKEKEKEASAGFDLTTKEGRAAYRTKMAEKGVQFSDMLTKAHGKGGFTTQLDVKPTGDLAKVETLEETHKAMLDIANAPPKVRKQAAEIQKLVLAGDLEPAMVEGLVAHGADPDAVKYWKAFYGQAKDGGSQFAADLVKEVSQKKAAEEKEAFKVKVARCYSLAHEMSEKEMIGKDASAINEQVNSMLEWDDKSFDHLKKIVARQPLAKKASIPQVGILGGGDVLVPAPEAQPTDMKMALDAIFANRKF